MPFLSPMILIVSTSGLEATTCAVMDWIRHLGGACARMNGEDLCGAAPFTLSVSNESTAFSVALDGAAVDFRAVGAVFFRGRAPVTTPSVDAVPDRILARSMSRQMASELRQVRRSIYTALSDRPWLPDP